MSIVTIAIGGREFKLSCPEENRDKLIMLSEKLDSEIREMASVNGHSSLELLLIMKILKYMDQRLTYPQLVKPEVTENTLTEDFLTKEALADTQRQLSNIFAELKSMAKKVEEC